MILKLIFLFFSFNVFAQVPDWYHNKPKNDKLYIYSVGFADNYNDSILNALNNIIKIDEDYSSNIHINFSNYSIKKQEERDGVFYTLVFVKRNELFNLQIDNLKIINDMIEYKYSNLSRNSFERKKEIGNIIELINEAKIKIEVIKKINSFDERSLMKKYNNILNEFKNDNLSLSILIDDDYLLPFSDIFVNIINDSNIKINKNSKTKLIIGMNVDNRKIQNLFFVNSKLNLFIVDNSGITKYNYKNYISSSDKNFTYSLNENIEKIIDDFAVIFKELIN